MLNFDIPQPGHVQDAADRLTGIATATPLIRSEALSALCGGEIYLKLETLQRTGAFKFRGAFNCLAQVDRASYPDGVLAYSTGNHGLAVATVAKMLGLKATIVMPVDAPAVKMARARAQGAEIIEYDRTRESREEIAKRIGERGKYITVPPGDHHHVIAGQGTVALEAFGQLQSKPVDVVIVPCGGGGLAAGTCLARDLVGAPTEVWVAEPAKFDDTRRSLLSKEREVNAPGSYSICDALLAPTPAELPFELNRRGVSRGLVATDAEVMRAMRLLFEEFRVAAEPGGAVAVAAILSQSTVLRGKRAVIVVSGGNVDSDLFYKAIRAEA